MWKDFLDVVGFRSSYILNHTLIVSPLYQVTQKNNFVWDPEQQLDLEQIRQEIAYAVSFGSDW